MTSFVYVKLGREQTQHARREAAHRSTTARLYGARNGTNAETGLSSALADEIGALCELAVANYVGLPTNFGHDYDPDGADVGPIEELFAEFDHHVASAASLAQVHRASLRSGRQELLENILNSYL